MEARKIIIQGREITHVFSRCHDQNFFFQDDFIKVKILRLFAKYRGKYGIKIFEFILMDNHYHFIIETPNSECLSNFMRTVNSQIALAVNDYHNRDSQALRERFKSPIIRGRKYLYKVMSYIWLNRVEVDKKHDPTKDRFNSLSWRLNGKAPILVDNEEEQELLDHLLSDYDQMYIEFPNDKLQLIRSLFIQAMQEIGRNVRAVMDPFFENYHTIASQVEFEYRQEVVNAFRRTKSPPGYTCMPNASSPLKAEEKKERHKKRKKHSKK